MTTNRRNRLKKISEDLANSSTNIPLSSENSDLDLSENDPELAALMACLRSPQEDSISLEMRDSLRSDLLQRFNGYFCSDSSSD